MPASRLFLPIAGISIGELPNLVELLAPSPRREKAAVVVVKTISHQKCRGGSAVATAAVVLVRQNLAKGLVGALLSYPDQHQPAAGAENPWNDRVVGQPPLVQEILQISTGVDESSGWMEVS